MSKPIHFAIVLKTQCYVMEILAILSLQIHTLELEKIKVNIHYSPSTPRLIRIFKIHNTVQSHEFELITAE